MSNDRKGDDDGQSKTATIELRKRQNKTLSQPKRHILGDGTVIHPVADAERLVVEQIYPETLE